MFDSHLEYQTHDESELCEVYIYIYDNKSIQCTDIAAAIAIATAAAAVGSFTRNVQK